jgi:hypothetical protein
MRLLPTCGHSKLVISIHENKAKMTRVLQDPQMASQWVCWRIRQRGAVKSCKVDVPTGNTTVKLPGTNRLVSFFAKAD